MSQGAVAVGNDAPHHEAHILYKDGKRRDEPQGFTVHHGTRQHRYDAELLRTRHIQFRTGGNGTAGSGQGGNRRSRCGNHRGEHGGNQGCRLNRKPVFTTVPTTLGRKNMRGYERKRELLPLRKMPGKPVVMGYTGI